MTSSIRKIVTRTEDVLVEGGEQLDRPWRRAVAVAVVNNPWCGVPHTPDLNPVVESLAPRVAAALATRLVDALGGPEQVEAFGKAALVGLDGEIEHGAAFLHTPHLGELFRHVVRGESIIAFGETRGPAATTLTVPMWHKQRAATRSHYQAMDICVGDSPRPDEILIALGVADGPRPLARIGDRRTDAAVNPQVVLREVFA